MTDEQFDRLLAVQTAQLAALESIANTLQAIAIKQGTSGGHNWNRVRDFLTQAKSIVAGK